MAPRPATPRRCAARAGRLAARGAALGLVLLSACREGAAIPGSTCAAPADCLIYTSCSGSPDACRCQAGTCVLDPGAPSSTATGCRGCHGSLLNPAPPADVARGTDSTRVGVGAHQTHLYGGVASRPVSCATCHQVPGAVDDPGHQDSDLPAEVAWSGVAAPRGAFESSWDRDSATCINYCHGALLTGGTNTQPTWTRVDGTEAACGTCHGLPPQGDHPQQPDCEKCHAPTAGPGQTIANRMTHVDGVLQVLAGSCTTCHGSGSDPSPPRGVNGETATTDRAVGAHQSHLRDGPLRLAVDCSECHVNPASVDQPGHLDAPTLTWGPLARAGGANPSWDRAAATCASTWCHGNFPGGAANNKPVWTQVDGSQSACGSCHGRPPPAPHPQSTSCNGCHPQTVTPAGNIDVTGGKHINGVVEAPALACTSCHGSPVSGSAAPPVGTLGQTATTSRAVGAHDAHLDPSSWHRAVACTDCHPVPSAATHSNTLVELSFSTLARGDGGAPVWSPSAATCSGVYCHGASLLGAGDAGVTRRVPVWTQVDGTFNACGASCHTNPPAAPHPRLGQCASCHDAVVDAAGNVKAPDLHVNGVVEVRALACNGCHGGAANAAPPLSTTGASSTSATAVGAHQRHVRATTVAGAFDCDECHLTPVQLDDPGHLDSSPNAEVAFGPLATSGGAAPTWARGPGTCANNYCHGFTFDGGTNRLPAWTNVTGAPLGCTACHGNPPPLPHTASTACSSCHGGTVSDAGVIDLDGGLHLNGTIDVGGSTCRSCHGAAAANNDAPPLGTKGETATTSPAVGAHQAHLATSSWHRTVRCSDCHVVPISTAHSNLVVDFSLDGGAQYSAGTRTCTNVSCHGANQQPAKPGGSVLRAPVWTQVNGTYSACGSGCHTNPPGGTHVPSDQCAACHPSVINAAGTITNPALHVDGVVQSVVPSCSACHGGPGNAAPPVSISGATSTSDVAVGAHQRHLLDGPFRRAIACTECHRVPGAVDAGGHLDPAPAELTFGALARSGGAAPTWTRATRTCSGTYCHGATLGAGGTLTAPVWTTVNGTQAACGTCHGHPPPLPHAQFTQCHDCHPGTVTAAETINLDGGHINGVVEQVPVHPPPSIWDTPGSGNFHGDVANGGLGACTTCHGATLTGGPANVSCASAACHATWKTSCTFCHGGTDNTSGAPPVDLADATATSNVTVGTHTAHLEASHALASPVACAACHVVPGDALSANHIDPRPAEVRFGALATTGGATPVWSRGAMTCGSTYCHGRFTGGNTATTPNWTDTTGAERACSRCHPSLQSTGKHPKHREKNALCDECHNTIVNGAGTLITTPSLHVNGVKDVRLKTGGTWNPATRACTPSCHRTFNW